MYPLVESTHVLTLCFFVGLAGALDLRLLGYAFTAVPMRQMQKRFSPWIVGSFIVMVATGVLLFYAIPVRSYQNIFFRIKIVLLVAAGLNAFVFHSGIDRRVATWDLSTVPPPAARRAGAASLVLWAVIIVCGRMIAYNWFDCDKQPQPQIVNTLIGCVVPPAGAR
jgi:ABC-type transport system involved in cytochrome c biogenesis permease subunit